MAIKNGKNCLHEDNVRKKMFAERRRICLKNMFAETYIFKKDVCGDGKVKKKCVCGRTFLIHPLQKNNGPSLIITHTY